MACYSEVRFPKAQPLSKIKETIQDLMREKFGTGYIVKETKHTLEVIFNDEVWNAPHVEYYIRGKKNIKALEYSDNCFGQLDAGWFANWLSSSIEEKLGGIHYSESLGEKYKSDFHTRNPTLYIWLAEKNKGFFSRVMSKSLFKEYMRALKKVLPPQVYEVYTKVKLRSGSGSN